jgi:hypothetical protein
LKEKTMAQAEGSFKVCGLCSQLVDESVKLPDDLLNHLIIFLNVAGELLPSKVCTDCFQGTTESKKFKVRNDCSLFLLQLEYILLFFWSLS